MDKNDVRAAVSQAKFNEEASLLLGIEIIFMSIILGWGFHSWWVFGGVFLGTMTALAASKIFANVLCLAFSLFWGFIGYGIGTLFHSPGAKVVLAIIAFVGTLGVHLSAVEWHSDMSS